MNNSENKLIGRGGIVVDIILTIIFFGFFTWILRPYVPAQSEVYVWFFSAFTASCLTGVFYIAVSMFRIVRVDQKNRSN